MDWSFYSEKKSHSVCCGFVVLEERECILSRTLMTNDSLVQQSRVLVGQSRPTRHW